MRGLYLLGFLASQSLFVFATSSDSSAQKTETNERTGRAWHHPASAPQTLQQLQQNQPPVFLQTSTNLPLSDTAAASDPNGGGRTFEEQDKSAIPAASEQDFLSRHYGYLNVHRFDPNFPYYDRHSYPRYPSPHSPRFGPGYRKDKYGHGYGYSCKHGDDCDEVRAANQLPHVPPPPPHIPPHHGPIPHHNIPPTPYNNPFVDIPAFSNLPPYSGHPSFPPYSSGGIYPPPRFNDLHMPLPHQIPPRFYHGRYLHDHQEDKKDEKENGKKDDAKEE